MCAVAKIATLQIAFTPIESPDYLKDIRQVLDIIKRSGLESDVGILSTFVRGEKSKVLQLINEIYEDMDTHCKFAIDIKISNLCGCVI